MSMLISPASSTLAALLVLAGCAPGTPGVYEVRSVVQCGAGMNPATLVRLFPVDAPTFTLTFDEEPQLCERDPALSCASFECTWVAGTRGEFGCLDIELQAGRVGIDGSATPRRLDFVIEASWLDEAGDTVDSCALEVRAKRAREPWIEVGGPNLGVGSRG